MIGGRAALVGGFNIAQRYSLDSLLIGRTLSFGFLPLLVAMIIVSSVIYLSRESEDFKFLIFQIILQMFPLNLEYEVESSLSISYKSQ